jgi:8-oxo-dGTP pyrophosphatase MutT (NUDIX family)
MNPDSIPNIVKEFSKTKKKFPDGRIDYTNEIECAVITIFVIYDGKLLLMKRSNKVGTYKGKWMAVAGYYDEPVAIRTKVEEELREEIGVVNYKKIETFDSLLIEDKEINKNWIVFNALVELNTMPEIVLDWEHTEYVWINPKELVNYDVTPSLLQSFRKVFK